MKKTPPALKARIRKWHCNGHHLPTPEDRDLVVMARRFERMGLDRSEFFEMLRRANADRPASPAAIR